MDITVKRLVNGSYPRPEDMRITFDLDRSDAFEVLEAILAELKGMNSGINLTLSFDGYIEYGKDKARNLSQG